MVFNYINDGYPCSFIILSRGRETLTNPGNKVDENQASFISGEEDPRFSRSHVKLINPVFLSFFLDTKKYIEETNS